MKARSPTTPARPSSAALASGLLVLAAPFLAAPGTAQEPVEAYRVDEQGSSVFAVVHRAGLLGFLGHEHAVVPHEWRAELCLPESGIGSVEGIPRDAEGAVVIRTSSLVIDSDSARALAGLGGGPGPEDVSDIQAKMLGPDFLDAETFPEIRLEVDSVAPGEDGGLLASGRLTVRDVTQDVTVPIGVEPSGDSIRVTGTFPIRQTDFGIEPESILGVVKVADEVDVHFSLAASATGEPCATDRG